MEIIGGFFYAFIKHGGQYEKEKSVHYEDLKSLFDGGAMKDDKTFFRLVGDYDIEEDIKNSE